MSIMLEMQTGIGPALVVGGGAVAARKARTLSEGGFAVRVVATDVTEGIAELRGVSVERRAFAAGDTDGFALVFACTDDREVNRMVGEECRAAMRPVLVADAPGESTIFSPAMHRDGKLSVGVSTGGAAPRAAQAIRDRIAEALGEGWEERIAEAQRAREATRGRTE